MPRYSLKKLLAAVTVCGIVLSVAQTAGYLVAVGVAICVYLVVRALRSKRSGWMLVPRAFVGIVCVVAIWFLAVDWSWFIWGCSDCRLMEDICGYRILGITIYEQSYEDDVYPSVYETVLADLGVPCRHLDSGTTHKHRWWGLTVCAFPCWNAHLGISGPDDPYSETIKERIRKRGIDDPGFADEMYYQIIVRENFDYMWDALLIDEFVTDSIHNGTSEEALTWLAESTSLIYGPEGLTTEKKPTIDMVQQIYLSGAVEVLEINIEKFNAVKNGDAIFDEVEHEHEYESIVNGGTVAQKFEKLLGEKSRQLAVLLPKNITDRKRVFAWANTYWNTTGHFPSKDYGQNYLIIYLD